MYLKRNRKIFHRWYMRNNRCVRCVFLYVYHAYGMYLAILTLRFPYTCMQASSFKRWVDGRIHHCKASHFGFSLAEVQAFQVCVRIHTDECMYADGCTRACFVCMHAGMRVCFRVGISYFLWHVFAAYAVTRHVNACCW